MSAEYRVQLFTLADSTTYGVGSLVAEFERMKNLGYSEYANEVGEAFFTIYQDDPKIRPSVRAAIRDGGHVKILRNNQVVWSGALGATDENETDAVIYAYGYASELYKLHTDWGSEWTGQKVQQIVTDAWNRARTGLSDSRVGWMSTGTIESPVTTSGGSTEIVLPFYRADYKRILFLIQEMAAFSISDTTNRVLFEITPDGTFNFWKNRGSDLTTLRFEWGQRGLVGFRRYRVPTDRRNVIHAVGSSPRDIVLRTTVEDATDRGSKGRLEEALYFSWVRDASELDRVARLRLERAKREDSDMSLTFAANAITPSRATGSLYRLTDTVPIKVVHGLTNVDDRKMIVGEQVLMLRGQEHVRLLMRDRL
jgi:hypothetical protein